MDKAATDDTVPMSGDSLVHLVKLLLNCGLCIDGIRGTGQTLCDVTRKF